MDMSTVVNVKMTKQEIERILLGYVKRQLAGTPGLDHLVVKLDLEAKTYNSKMNGERHEAQLNGATFSIDHSKALNIPAAPQYGNDTDD